MPTSKDYDHKIIMKGDTNPINVRPYIKPTYQNKYFEGSDNLNVEQGGY